jgi:tRNA (cmo5U34)-methyltransferase
MQNQKTLIVFDEERAASYDQGNAKFAPINGALHFLIRVVLSDLPANAQILCVGVGTGLELLYLAQAFPKWQFTAVEPAAPMLNLCHQRAEENGITSRITFHEGYLDSLPATDLFDAATCLFVSHFLRQPEDRCQFFSQIASRLRPNGYLVNAALASDRSSSNYENLLEVWLRMLKSSGMPIEQIAQIPASFSRDIAMLPLPEVESIMASSGFNAPVLFFQTLLIHAWYAQRSSRS